MAVTREFTNLIQDFLLKEGYTHILSVGIKDNKTEDYFLVPLQPGDERLRYEESDFGIAKIKSAEITEMAMGDPFISFWIELPYDLNQKLIQ